MSSSPPLYSPLFTVILYLCIVCSTEYTEWQRPLPVVHSIMMEKLAQVGKGGECTPAPFHDTLANFAGVVDTGGTDVNSTGGKFAARVNETGGK
jgi:hypothetical protein